jgi:hypothetical protein
VVGGRRSSAAPWNHPKAHGAIVPEPCPAHRIWVIPAGRNLATTVGETATPRHGPWGTLPLVPIHVVEAVHVRRLSVVSFRADGALAVVCRRSVGSRRPCVCGKSPEGLAFAVHMWARGYSLVEGSCSSSAGCAAVLVAALRRRVAAAGSRPSFFSSSALQPSRVALT